MAANVTPNLADKLSGYESPSCLHALLEAVCAELRREEESPKVNLIQAKGLRVLPEYSGDLYNAMNATMNKKLSVFIQVGFEQANADHKSLSAMLKDIRLVVFVYESVLFNQSAQGTKVSALTFAETALARLHQFRPTATDDLVNPQPIRMAENNTLGLERDESKPAQGMICYAARFVTGQCLKCHCSS